ATVAVSDAVSVVSCVNVARGSEVVRGFWCAGALHVRRSLAVGALTVGGSAVLGIDVIALSDHRPGALFVPLLLVLGLLLWTTALLALVAGVERPEARLRDVLKASLFLGVRRWYLTVGSFLAMGSLLALFLYSPALALWIATTPLLYAAWGNSRYSLRPVLPHGAVVRTG